MKKCWHADPAKRPAMDDVIKRLKKTSPQSSTDADPSGLETVA